MRMLPCQATSLHICVICVICGLLYPAIFCPTDFTDFHRLSRGRHCPIKRRACISVKSVYSVGYYILRFFCPTDFTYNHRFFRGRHCPIKRRACNLCHPCHLWGIVSYCCFFVPRISQITTGFSEVEIVLSSDELAICVICVICGLISIL